MSRKRTSRRVFLKLLAAGTAAALAAPASSLAATRKRSPRAGAAKPAPARTAAGGHVALPAEIDKQRKSTAASLKVLRDYSLPAGSPQAFSFRPLKARRGRRSS